MVSYKEPKNSRDKTIVHIYDFLNFNNVRLPIACNRSEDSISVEDIPIYQASFVGYSIYLVNK